MLWHSLCVLLTSRNLGRGRERERTFQKKVAMVTVWGVRAKAVEKMGISF